MEKFDKLNEIERANELERIFDCYFDGQPNITTPNVLWHFMEKFGDEILMVEISEGADFHDNPIFGATTLVMTPEGTVQRIDLNKFAPSLDTLLEYADNITSDIFHSADRYGEAKHLNTMRNI